MSAECLHAYKYACGSTKCCPFCEWVVVFFVGYSAERKWMTTWKKTQKQNKKDTHTQQLNVPPNPNDFQYHLMMIYDDLFVFKFSVRSSDNTKLSVTQNRLRNIVKVYLKKKKNKTNSYTTAGACVCVCDDYYYRIDTQSIALNLHSECEYYFNQVANHIHIKSIKCHRII